MAEIIHKQDGIEYKIVDDILKGWKGESPFKRPEWDGSLIVEGWTQADTDAQNTAKIKDDKIKDHLNSENTIWVGKTPDGLKDFAVFIDNTGKLQTIEIT